MIHHISSREDTLWERPAGQRHGLLGHAASHPFTQMDEPDQWSLMLKNFWTAWRAAGSEVLMEMTI
ncbi:MAG: hypothetical protein IKD69_13475 [Solobacterium sp.]|nr:hypothetical protein [Solobacterium sp.]